MLLCVLEVRKLFKGPGIGFDAVLRVQELYFRVLSILYMESQGFRFFCSCMKGSIALLCV